MKRKIIEITQLRETPSERPREYQYLAQVDPSMATESTSWYFSSLNSLAIGIVELYQGKNPIDRKIEESLACVKAERDALKEDREVSKRKVSELVERLRWAKQWQDEAAKNLRLANGQRDLAVNELGYVRADRDAINAKLAELLPKMDELEKLLRAERTVNWDTAQKLDNVTRHFMTAESRCVEFKSEIDALKESVDRQIKENHRVAGALSQTVSRLDDELTKAKQSLSIKQQDCEELGRRLMAAVKQREAVETEKLERENGDLRWKSFYEMAIRQRDSVTSELLETRKERDRAIHERDSRLTAEQYQAVVDSYNGSIRRISQERDYHAKGVEDLKEQCNAVEAERAKMQQEIVQLQGKINSPTSEKEHKRDSLKAAVLDGGADGTLTTLGRLVTFKWALKELVTDAEPEWYKDERGEWKCRIGGIVGNAYWNLGELRKENKSLRDLVNSLQEDIRRCRREIYHLVNKPASAPKQEAKPNFDPTPEVVPKDKLDESLEIGDVLFHPHGAVAQITHIFSDSQSYRARLLRVNNGTTGEVPRVFEAPIEYLYADKVTIRRSIVMFPNFEALKNADLYCKGRQSDTWCSCGSNMRTEDGSAHWCVNTSCPHFLKVS